MNKQKEILELLLNTKKPILNQADINNILNYKQLAYYNQLASKIRNRILFNKNTAFYNEMNLQIEYNYCNILVR